MQEKSKRGIVYVLTNHYLSDLVKIGRTKNLPDRLVTLNTAVPQNFDVRCAVEVPDAVKLEGQLHKAFEVQGVGRIRATRRPEFFKVPFENVVSAMKLAVALIEGAKFVRDDHKVGNMKDDPTPDVSPNGEAEKQARKGQEERGRINFSALDIQKGSTLSLSRDPKKTAKVVSNSTVKYEGDTLSPSKAAQRAMGYPYGISGSEYWEYEGEILSARRKRLAGE